MSQPAGMHVSLQTPPTSANSRWIWPFEILDQIGEGGMGVVYRARYVVNGRNVALKMLPGDVTDKTALARFERELDVLKTLRHPNIVRCFGGVCEDKRRFYAMELVEGGNLDEKLQSRGKLAWEQVIYYGLQMCAALECSHGKGVVHRDIKPSNFLLTPSGQLKLSDFGLASVLAARKITAAGKTAGTFLYMAPEQIRGQDVTPRTDLYALGCVLYELLTGEPPFVGETPGATLHLHCYSAPPRATAKALDCPVALESIILKLMSKEPDDRYESATAVARELRSVHQTIVVTTPRKETLQDLQPAFDEGQRIARELEEKTAPNMSALKSRRNSLVLAVALAASLLLNCVQWWSGQSDWEVAWHQAANAPNTQIRIAAMEALGGMAAEHSTATESLISSLKDDDASVRAAAARGLGRAGGPSQRIVGALLNAQKHDESEDVRSSAGQAIETLRLNQTHRSPWQAISYSLLILAAAGAGTYFWLGKR
ncbi:protein kinase domain-containing protein [Planctomicrobium sp. SH664]|uniref:serine/threonine-protein kinase n=1 Tax=Planctomicrobium sp. SH664 TaxID=3448125 RepID=UPI003F5BCA34